jgi:hypothetical protein
VSCKDGGGVAHPAPPTASKSNYAKKTAYEIKKSPAIVGANEINKKIAYL